MCCSGRVHISPDLQRLAAKQRGYLSIEQLYSGGMSRGQVHRRRRSSGWSFVFPGVIKLPGAREDRDGLLVAASLWMGERGRFYGQTAADIYRLEVARPQNLQVTVMGGKRVDGLEVHRWRHGSARVVNGLPVPHVEQVLLECAVKLDSQELGSVVDETLRKKMTTVERLRDFLDEPQVRGRTGSQALRAATRYRDVNDQQIRSVMEARMLRILRSIDGLRFIPDHPMQVDSESFILDFFLPEPQVGIECHSRRWHGPEASAGDLRRDRAIRSAGIELLYFDWEDVTAHAGRTSKEISAAVARRLRILRPQLFLPGQ